MIFPSSCATGWRQWFEVCVYSAAKTRGFFGSDGRRAEPADRLPPFTPCRRHRAAQGLNSRRTSASSQASKELCGGNYRALEQLLHELSAERQGGSTAAAGTELHLQSRSRRFCCSFLLIGLHCTPVEMEPAGVTPGAGGAIAYIGDSMRGDTELPSIHAGWRTISLVDELPPLSSSHAGATTDTAEISASRTGIDEMATVAASAMETALAPSATVEEARLAVQSRPLGAWSDFAWCKKQQQQEKKREEEEGGGRRRRSI